MNDVATMPRDYDRVLLAEDDRDRAMEMMALLQDMGGYDVRITKRKREIMRLLKETDAGWLILDLNLEDENSADLVPIIREYFGKSIFIIVLSGYFEDYPEYDLLSKGADLYLRKPYRPKSMLIQMDALRARMEGVDLKPAKKLKLKIGNGVLDLDSGIYKVGKKELHLPKYPMKLMKILVSHRDEDGWVFAKKSLLMTFIWGEDRSTDPQLIIQRFRRLKSDTVRFFDKDVIEVNRVYDADEFRFSGEVELIEEV